MKLLPMLAKDLPVGFKSTADYTAEEKYDGMRVIIDTTSGVLQSWSRNGNDATQRLNDEIARQLLAMPKGMYDTELVLPGVSGSQSSDVMTKLNKSKCELVVFDVLNLLGTDCYTEPQYRRRKYLSEIFNHVHGAKVSLARAWDLGKHDVFDVVGEVWENGGEGLIIKPKLGVYRPGKRDKSFLKLKQFDDTTVRIIGFERGTSFGVTGPNCIALCVDAEGVNTQVKVPTNLLRDAVAKDETQFVNRSLMIRYTQRTPDGSYRHPRWKELV